MKQQSWLYSADQSVRRQQLSTVVALRTFAVCGQVALVLSVFWGLKVSLPLNILFSVLAALAVVNGLTWWHVRHLRPIGPYALLVQLLLDVLAFSVLLYYTGGVTNPFVSLYLPLLGLAAALLPWRQVLVLASVSVLAYGVLMQYYQPLHVHMHDHDSMVNLHLWGMGVNFLLSVFILVGFVARLSGSLRKREHDLADAQSRLVSEERLAALGNQAASIAHQLGTPVSTIAMIVSDWQDNPDVTDRSVELQALSSQVLAIQHTLQHLRDQIDQAENIRTLRQVDDWRVVFDGFVADWRNRNPEQELQVLGRDSMGESVSLDIEPMTLSVSLQVLLDNAKQSHVRAGVVAPLVLCIHDHPTQWECHVQDMGEGIAPELMLKLGQEVITQGNNAAGQGMGVFLVVNLLERQGAQLRFENRAPQGVLARLTIQKVQVL